MSDLHKSRHEVEVSRDGRGVASSDGSPFFNKDQKVTGR